MAKVSREERIKYARNLITANPNWGKDRVNQALRKHFGIGLGRAFVGRLKDETLLGQPKVGLKPLGKLIKEAILLPEMAERRVITIGFDLAYHQLRSVGFIDNEIREFFGAGNAPELFNTKPFKAMIASRRQWLKDKLKRGWARGQILAAIKGYYTRPARSPFDFLRAEYKPPLKIDFKEYREAARRRGEAKIGALY